MARISAQAAQPSLRDHRAMARSDSSHTRIYAVVERIPRGRVATYGQIAHLAGLPGHARQVGYALHAMDTDRPVPWHRVINARGEISLRDDADSDDLQRRLLECEGVVFDGKRRVDLERYQWRPVFTKSRPHRTVDRF